MPLKLRWMMRVCLLIQVITIQRMSCTCWRILSWLKWQERLAIWDSEETTSIRALKIIAEDRGRVHLPHLATRHGWLIEASSNTKTVIRSDTLPVNAESHTKCRKWERSIRRRILEAKRSFEFSSTLLKVRVRIMQMIKKSIWKSSTCGRIFFSSILFTFLLIYARVKTVLLLKKLL